MQLARTIRAVAYFKWQFICNALKMIDIYAALLIIQLQISRNDYADEVR